MVWFREGVDLEILFKMLDETVKRGIDAFGMSIISKDNISTYKWTESYENIKVGAQSLLTNLNVGGIIIWNNRAKPMTEVESTDVKSVQPIFYKEDKLVMVHNGVIANDKILQKQEGLKLKTPIDSEVFLSLYKKFGRNPKRVLKEIIGGSAYILYDGERKKLIIIRDFKPLGKAYKKGIGYFVMSDSQAFKNIFGNMDVAVWEDFYYSDLEEFTINEIDIDSGLIDRENFNPNYISSLPEPQKKKVLVMASGGVDSSTVAMVAKKLYKQEVILVHFNIGQKSEERELEAVKYLSKKLNSVLLTIDLKWLGKFGESPLTDKDIKIPKGNRLDLKSTVCWTPARNLVFASCLMAIAESVGASKIYNGWTLEEEGAYPDNSIDFFRSLNMVLNFGTLTRPKIVMVEQNLMKPEIILLGKYLGLDFDKLWSCDNGLEKECGNCGACWLKRKALKIAKEKKYDVKNIIGRLIQ